VIVGEGIPQAVDDHRIGQLARPHLHAVAQMHDVAGLAHALLAAGHDDAGVARLDHLRRDQARAADGALYGKESYVAAGCGMGYEATMYLLERGVRVTGTDAWSWDAPFVYTAKRYAETGDAKLIWEGHKAGRDIGYCHIEKLHNLETLPSDGFQIACFPCKVRGGSAGWTRAVAILP
jgi:hypothetical protein